MATTQDRIQGLIGDLGVKPPVLVATTAAITLSGEQTIDGVAVVAEDRVLVKDQSDTTTNGIYYCQASTWVRAPDFDGTRDALQGTLVVVAVGTANAGTLWRLTTASPVIGTSNLTFSLFPISASAFVQTLLDDTTAGAFLTTLGVSAFAQTVLDDADAATARATLGAVGVTGNETVAGNKTFTGVNAYSGRNDNTATAAGYIGEVISSTIASGSAVALSNGVQTNITSITLTAGDWDVFGNVLFTYGSTTNITHLQGSTGTVSATIDTTARFAFVSSGFVPGTTSPTGYTVPAQQVKVANGATQVVYLVGYGSFTVSTLSAYGKIWARRSA
jgi:hypothetical protein